MYREEALGSPGGDGGGAGPDPQGVGRRREWGRRRGEGEVAQDAEADAPGEGGVVDQLLQRVGHHRGVLLQQLRYNCDQIDADGRRWKRLPSAQRRHASSGLLPPGIGDGERRITKNRYRTSTTLPNLDPCQLRDPFASYFQSQGRYGTG
ncbi:hypothetical protein BHE74_00017249 [Ensete ventricosum]|nr:hypothetical protein BHE74_00017249 [Ensete ventricosum]